MRARMHVALGALIVAVTLLIGVDAAATRPLSGRTGTWNETSPGFVLPDDPFLREQWWLFNFGQQVGQRVDGKADADVRAPEAWSITTGSPDVVVAVLDFGIDYDHPDFDGQLWTNVGETGSGREANGVDDDGNGYVDDWRGWDFIGADNDPLDESGHGSPVSSVLAAKGGDGVGITGIAPGVRIMPLRVADTGVDQTITPAAIEYAARMGARIVVQSYTTEPSGLFDKSDAETAAMLAHPELLFVTGAGNDGNDYRNFDGRTGNKPCNNPTVPNLICVAGTDRFDEPWSESTFGIGRVHIAAPAESMLVAVRPREVVASDGFDDPGKWSPATDFQGYWAAEGPAPTFSFETDDTASDGRVLRISQSTSGTASAGVLRYNQRVDLTGRTGCDVNARVGGEMSGAGGLSLGLFRERDERRNAFGGELALIGNDLDDAGELAPFSSVADASEPLELAVKAETRRGSDATIDVRIDGVDVDCWNPQHGDRDYEYWAGTSFATPLVAGVAALVASAEPQLDTMQIRHAVLESAEKIPALEALVQTGGRVDAFAALQRAAEIAEDEAGEAAGPVSFAPHDDYEMPNSPGELGMPSGRGVEDPGATSTDERAVNENTSDESGSGGFPPWVWAGILAAAGVMGAGALAWARANASPEQRAELDAKLAEIEAEADAVRSAEESKRRTEELAQQASDARLEALLRDHPSVRAGLYEGNPQWAERWASQYPPEETPRTEVADARNHSAQDVVQYMRDGYGTTTREQAVQKGLDGELTYEDDQRLQETAVFQSGTNKATSEFVGSIDTGTTDAGADVVDIVHRLFKWMSGGGK